MQVRWQKVVAPALAIPLVLGGAACGDDDDAEVDLEDVSEGVEDLSEDVSEGVDDASTEIEQQIEEGEEEGGGGGGGYGG